MRLGDCHPRPGEWGSPRWTAAGGRGGQLRVDRCSGPDRPRGQRRSAWAASPVCLGKLPEPSFHGGAGLWGGRWHRPSVSARACGRDGRAWRRAGTQRPRPAAGPREGRCGGAAAAGGPPWRWPWARRDPGTGQGLGRGSGARRARAGPTSPSRHCRHVSGGLSQQGAQNRAGCSEEGFSATRCLCPPGSAWDRHGAGATPSPGTRGAL